MNQKQRMEFGKLAFDLVKVPLAVCMLAPLMDEGSFVWQNLFFGATIGSALIYVGYRFYATVEEQL